MRFLEIIYYSQYYELKKAGKDPLKGRVNGTLLSATIIMLNLGSALLLLFKLAPHSGIARWLKHLFSGYDGSGKALGKIIAALLLVVVGGLLWFTISSVSSYNRIAEKYMQLPEETQQKTIKQSLFLFMFSFALFLIFLFIL